MSLIWKEDWGACRQGTQISRKAQQICPDSSNRCFNRHGRNRNYIPLDIKRKLNKHSMITNSGRVWGKRGHCWWVSRCHIWSVLLSLCGWAATAAPSTGLPRSHIQSLFQVNKQTKEQRTKAVVHLNLVGWWRWFQQRLVSLLFLLWSLSCNLFLPANGLFQFRAWRFSPGKCLNTTEGAGWPITSKGTNTQSI